MKQIQIWRRALCVAAVLFLSGCTVQKEAPSQSEDVQQAETEKLQEAEEAEDAQEALQIPNPMQEAASAEDFEEIGVHMKAPEGAEDLMYFIISNQVADMRFTLDGREWTFRGSATAEDFAGIFERFREESLELSCEEGGDTAQIHIRTTESGGRLADWQWGDVRYTLYTPSEISDEPVSELVLELARLTRGGN